MTFLILNLMMITFCIFFKFGRDKIMKLKDIVKQEFLIETKGVKEYFYLYKGGIKDIVICEHKKGLAPNCVVKDFLMLYKDDYVITPSNEKESFFVNLFVDKDKIETYTFKGIKKIYFSQNVIVLYFYDYPLEIKTIKFDKDIRFFVI